MVILDVIQGVKHMLLQTIHCEQCGVILQLHHRDLRHVMCIMETEHQKTVSKKTESDVFHHQKQIRKNIHHKQDMQYS